MRNKITFLPQFFKRGLLFEMIVCGLLISVSMQAQLPTAQQVAGKLKVGWNLGNILEATWIPRNSFGTTTQAAIDSVKAAGFNTVRLPVAWYYHSNITTSVIEVIVILRGGGSGVSRTFLCADGDLGGGRKRKEHENKIQH